MKSGVESIAMSRQTLYMPRVTLKAFGRSRDQDQTAQNVQSDFGSVLSVFVRCQS